MIATFDAKCAASGGETGSYFAYNKSKKRKRLDVEVIDRILAELIPNQGGKITVKGPQKQQSPEAR